MAHKTLNNVQGHWILARMGKKVLRPGGIELTEKMINGLNIESKDDVVEFAPGLGLTALMTLKRKPNSYIGIEINEEAAKLTKKQIAGNGQNTRIIVADVVNTGLDSESCNKVYGEAMLTMQSNKKKDKIIKEAHRILKTGGYYGIHELALQPDNLSSEKKVQVQKALQNVIKVNARPLTVKEWQKLLKDAGFKIVHTYTSPMHLLEPKRLLADEGLKGIATMSFNMLINPSAGKKVLSMRQVFRQFKDQMCAVSIIACKT